jgi:fatty acid desaturase
VYWIARIHVAIYVVVIGWSLMIGSILPLMYVGLPSFYGAWLYIVTGLTQHAGLAEDVLDHRLNSRTVYMNPIVRFLYWNMNYHVEHHMFPMIPYHNLPALHEEVKADMPKPYSGFLEAYREIIPALLRQAKDPTYYVERKLPPTARPLIPLPPERPAVAGVA